MNPVNISPTTLLAAVLYNLGKTVKMKVKLDDTGEEKEVETPVVQLSGEEDTIMCVIPLTSVVHFATNVYQMHYNTVKSPTSDDLFAVVGFEKQEKAPVLVGMNGKAIGTKSHFKNLFNSFFHKEVKQ